MQAAVENIQEYISGQGLRNEAVLGGYEAKSVPADFAERAERVISQPEGTVKERNVRALYDEIQRLPITAGRTLDPVAPEEILSWCPLIRSPFSYSRSAAKDSACEKAAQVLRAGPEGRIFSRAERFISSAPPDFGLEKVIEFAGAGSEGLCDAERTALDSVSRGVPAEKAACSANPFRAGFDSVFMGAAFGLAYYSAPDLAASRAMVYASLSHFKGGVYAAMWAASLTAHAASISDREVCSVRALNTVPLPTQFFKAVAWMQRNLNCGVDARGCADWLHGACDPRDDFVFRSCYANACSVTASLLYSQSPEQALELADTFGYMTESCRSLVSAINILSGC